MKQRLGIRKIEVQSEKDRPLSKATEKSSRETPQRERERERDQVY